MGKEYYYIACITNRKGHLLPFHKKGNLEMTIDKVKELLSKQLRIEKGKINDDSNLIEDLGADSIDLVEMLLTIEENLGVNVPDEDAINLKTVRDIAEYIEAHS